MHVAPIHVSPIHVSPMHVVDFLKQCLKYFQLYLTSLCDTYGCRFVNCDDILAKAAKQFVWRYLSCEKKYHLIESCFGFFLASTLTRI